MTFTRAVGALALWVLPSLQRRCFARARCPAEGSHFLSDRQTGARLAEGHLVGVRSACPDLLHTGCLRCSFMAADLKHRAEHGDASAQCSLAAVHESTRNGPQDFAEARRLYSLAAAQGHKNAQCFLAAMHMTDDQGGPHNFREAKRLYGLAASAGHARAQFMLADMNFKGQGGQNLPEARRLFELAAAQGHAGAQCCLAGLIAKGEGGGGGKPDLVDARRLYGLAAAQGHELARYRLATMTAEGQGGPRDADAARRLFGLEESPEVRAAAADVANAVADARAAGVRAAAAAARVQVRAAAIIESDSHRS